MSPDHSLMSKDATWWRVSGLLDARSLFGAVGIVAVVVLFVLFVPFLSDNVEQTGVFDDAGRLIVDEYTTMALPEGWRVEGQSQFFTNVSDGTYQLFLPVSNLEVTSPEDSLGEYRDLYAADPANKVTEITSLATDDGAPAAVYRLVLASDPTGQGSGFGAVSQNGRLFEPAATGPPDLSDPFYDSFEEMVRSIVITAEAREGSQ